MAGLWGVNRAAGPLAVSILHSSLAMPPPVSSFDTGGGLLTCAMVCSSSTACPQAALISSHPTSHSSVRPSRNPLMVPKWPSCLWQAQAGGERARSFLAASQSQCSHTVLDGSSIFYDTIKVARRHLAFGPAAGAGAARKVARVKMLVCDERSRQSLDLSGLLPNECEGGGRCR
jgi:hypothetical protein